MNATIKVVAVKEPRADGSLPVKLRIIHSRKVRYFPLGRHVHKKDWNESAGRFARSYPGWREENDRLLEYEQRAAVAVRKFEMERQVFTFERFKAEVFSAAKNTAVAWEYIESIQVELKAAGKLGNAAVYRSCANRVRAFRSKSVLADIDRAWLSAFERFLLTTCSGGGASAIMRTLRASCNHAERSGQMPRGWSPFSEYSISHLKGRGIKKALTLDEIRALESADVPPTHRVSIDLFLLSFYLRGANMSDIAAIKHSDISGGRLVYFRKKTGGRFSMAVTEKAQAIFDKYYIPGELYAAPVLKMRKHVTAVQIRERVRCVLEKLNKQLREVAAAIGINTECLTFYSARHSYATALERKGVSRAVISQALGHASIKTTETYLKQFGDQELDEADGLLG